MRGRNKRREQLALGRLMEDFIGTAEISATGESLTADSFGFANGGTLERARRQDWQPAGVDDALKRQSQQQ